MRILVVDDDPDLCLLMELFLSRAGHQVVLAADGAIAWSLLDGAAGSAHPVDMVVADWMMPNLDGIGLCRAMRADLRFKSVPFLMVTARPDVQEPREVGVDGLVAKPFTGSLLVRAVDDLGGRLACSGASA